MKLLSKLKERLKKWLWWSGIFIELLFWDWWHTKILLINYTGKTAHHGCIATSRSLVRMIKKRYPGSIVRCQPIDFEIPKMAIPVDDKDIEKFLTKYIPIEKERFRFFKWADIIILNGEGSIHEYPEPRFNQYCLSKLMQIYAAKEIYRKRAFAVNQTIDYKDEKFGRIIKRCYEPLDYVAVREINSFNKCMEAGLSNAALAADAAFLSKKGSSRQANKRLSMMGVQEGFVCVFLSEIISGCSQEKIVELIKKIKERFKKDILLCVTTRADRDYYAKIKNRIDVFTFGMEIPAEDLIAMLAYADIVISGRFHCCIFSFLAGTPLLPFRSNTYKVEGLMKSMDYPVRVYDYSRDENTSIVSEIERILDNAGHIKKRIEEGIEKMKRLAERNIP